MGSCCGKTEMAYPPAEVYSPYENYYTIDEYLNTSAVKNKLAQNKKELSGLNKNNIIINKYNNHRYY